MQGRIRRLAAGFIVALLVFGARIVAAQPADSDEAAYAPATLAKIMGGGPRSHNDEAELAAPGQWFHTTATFTGRKRPLSGRFRPIVGAWVSSRGSSADEVEMFFSGELPELEFEQGGKKYWIMAGLPGGLGFGIYPPGQKLTIYLQKVGYASGTPVAMLTLARLPGGATSVTVPAQRRMRNARMGEGTRRQEATYKGGSATFTYAGREYTLPLDVTGRHSVAPGLYSYENGVRTALLEFGADDAQYLLLRVPVTEDGGAPDIVPYLVLNGRIVPPIDLGACEIRAAPVGRDGASGTVDCTPAPRAVLTRLQFSANGARHGNSGRESP